MLAFMYVFKPSAHIFWMHRLSQMRSQVPNAHHSLLQPLLIVVCLCAYWCLTVKVCTGSPVQQLNALSFTNCVNRTAADRCTAACDGNSYGSGVTATCSDGLYTYVNDCKRKQYLVHNSGVNSRKKQRSCLLPRTTAFKLLVAIMQRASQCHTSWPVHKTIESSKMSTARR